MSDDHIGVKINGVLYVKLEDARKLREGWDKADERIAELEAALKGGEAMIHDDFPPHAQAREDAMLAEKAQARAELRDRFAMAALTGVLAHPTRFNNFYDDVAESAWDYADAMLKARATLEGGKER